jgi:glycosyltransferase involved in cell wall biosynthesis
MERKSFRPLISVVVTTWRRPEALEQVLTALGNQTLPKDSFEVIVVDSNSADETEVVVARIKERCRLTLQYLHAAVNSASAKRNLGIESSGGEFVAFLDDDCIPAVNHLHSFLASANEHRGQLIVWCGGVFFDPKLVKSSNYYRYRDSCHFSSLNRENLKLNFKTIVTMNMFIEKKLLEDFELRFDERFIGYGFEDIHFGFILQSKGFRILAAKADVMHLEANGDIKKFRVKYFHSGRDGMPSFLEAAPNAESKLGLTAWLEESQQRERGFTCFLRALLHKVLDSRLPSIVTDFLMYSDRWPLFYSRSLYRISLASAYREGVRARKSWRTLTIERANRDGWYQ